MTGHANAHVDGGAVWMDHGHAFFTVRFQFVAMFPHVGMEHQDHAGLLGAVQQRLVHDAGVLNAVARIRARILRLRPLDGSERHVDFTVAVGVSGDLETGVVHGLKRLVQGVLM